jgi:F-type H+-transporting ATPase subunit a
MNLLASDFTWFNLIPGYDHLQESIGHNLYYTYIEGEPVAHITHLALVLLSALIILALGMRARSRWAADDGGVVPDGSFTTANVMESLLDTVLTMSEQVLGSREKAVRFMPIIGTCALYILVNNLLGLVPGFAPATDNLNITVGPAMVIFFATHIYGLKENGMHHITHFFGPKIGGVPWLAPIMLPIELISHLARPLSLSLRLMGNMTGDHKVLAIFLGLAYFTVPFVILGTLVCIVQTLVFCLLSMVYISLAIEHSEEAH